MLFGDFPESQSKDFKEVVDEEESTVDYGYSSDSDLEDDEDTTVAAESGIRPSDSIEALVEDEVAPGDHEEGVKKGKVVKIPDVAFVT